jgi:hypothetical protein
METTMRIARSVTRIRKFEPPTLPPPRWSEDADSEPDEDDVVDTERERRKSNSEEEGNEVERELRRTSDEIARIYWKWFSSNRIIFRGRITSREEFLPKCGKLKG